MSALKLPSLRAIVENIPLQTAKLDRILAESQSRVASYLDIRYQDCQEIIFLLGGKAVKAGRFNTKDNSRMSLKVKDALQRLKQQEEGMICFYEISKVLMVIILGTFVFKPTHAKLKSKLIDFHSLLELLARKHFIGYLELKTRTGLNYLTFFNGQARDGYFTDDVSAFGNKTPAEIIAALVEQSDEKGEINVYDSVGEEGLQDHGRQAGLAEGVSEEAPTRTAYMDDEGTDQYTGEMVDMVVMSIFEEFFRRMAAITSRQLPAMATDTLFMECLKDATLKHATLFRGAGTKEDGSLLPTGLINFERLLKSKVKLPSATREKDFLEGLADLTSLRLEAMQRGLDPDIFQKGLPELRTAVAGFRKNYQGNYAITKYLDALTTLIDRY